jgi:hypothetical protein
MSNQHKHAATPNAAPETGQDAPEQPLTLNDDGYPSAPEEEPEKPFADLPDARPGGAPGWVKIPEGFTFPRGRQVAFLRFRGTWTDTPDKGERQCILWALTDADEKMALSRAQGDVNRAANELAKQMVRALDGHVADWSGNPGVGNIDQWWNEIGGRCRGMLVRIFTQLHVLNTEERKDFFEHCIELRTAG